MIIPPLTSNKIWSKAARLSLVVLALHLTSISPVEVSATPGLEYQSLDDFEITSLVILDDSTVLDFELEGSNGVAVLANRLLAQLVAEDRHRRIVESFASRDGAFSQAELKTALIKNAQQSVSIESTVAYSLSTLNQDEARIEYLFDNDRGEISIPREAFHAYVLAILDTWPRPDGQILRPSDNEAAHSYFQISDERALFFINKENLIVIARGGENPFRGDFIPEVLQAAGSVHSSVYGQIDEAIVSYDDGTGEWYVRVGTFLSTKTVMWWLALSILSVAILLSWRAMKERDASRLFRRRLLSVRENERARLAAELHDGPVQELQDVIRRCRKAIERNQREIDLHLLNGRLTGVTHTLRDICADLRPPVLQHFGLVDAVRFLASDFSSKFPGLSLHLDLADIEKTAVDEEQRLVAYRIVQESLNNVVKHARARNVWIAMHRDGNYIDVVVRDDGQGFIPNQNWSSVERRGHLGLSLAMQRASSVGGKLKVESDRGLGTKVNLSMRLNGPAISHGFSTN